MPRIDSKQSLKMKRKQIQNPRHGQLMQLKLANSKDDMKFGTSQARLNEDEAVRVAYKHGTPLEGGKIADSEPVDLFSSAHNIPKAQAQACHHHHDEDSNHNQSQMKQDELTRTE